MSQLDEIPAKLQNLLHRLQLDDAPAGGSVVVYYQDRLLATAQIGQALENTAWSVDTLALNFSTGKGVLVTLVHILVSQGLLDYDTPISHYWQQFASHGKQDITLRQVLSHQANLFDISLVTNCSRDLLDWQAMVAKIALMSPHAPEAQQRQSAYSALVSGWVLGGLIEQVCQQPLNQVLHHYLTEPLGIADAVYFGVPENKVRCVAQPVRNFIQQVASQKEACDGDTDMSIQTQRSKKPTFTADSAIVQATYLDLPSYTCWQQHYFQRHSLQRQMDDKVLSTLQINGLYFDVANMSRSDYKRALVANAKHPLDYYDLSSLQAVIPAANGVASAQALARIYAMLANQGRWQGKTFINTETLTQLAKIHVTGSDAVMPAAAIAANKNSEPSMQWRLGYHRIFSICHDVVHGFGHMGYNGSVAWCDPKRQLSFAFVHNFDATMLTDIRQFALTEALLQWFDEAVNQDNGNFDVNPN